ncbi:flagellin [Eubacteriales bacterium OttesenSCG-928-N14]|nr:flagellin [Eubacteriales bacterium OttesenSCG-928-N14]
MRITNNIMALNTHRQYGINNAAVAKNTEKLSSGYRVNRAGDDAAGLAISEKMRAQIRGLTMASKNSQDAISLVQTAEGALQESHQILQRMRELAVQSASDTNEETIDRAALDAEYQQLIAELDDTAAKTKFNTMGLIDGTYAGGSYVDSMTGDSPVKVTFTPGADMTEGSWTLTVEADGSFKITNDADGTANYVTGAIDSIENGLKQGTHTIETAEGHVITYTLAEDLDAAADFAAVYAPGGEDYNLEIKSGLEFVVQTGANEGDELIINIDKMDANTLKVGATNVASREAASNAITLVDNAVNAVSTQRGKLGALQNRLQHKINNLDTSAENLQAAESRIRDLDMAKEMTAFTKNNILVQASTAMLAQANAAPQGVLSLLS